MSKTFDTRQFELNHGRLPRGRGGWAFAPAGSEAAGPRGRADDPAIVWANGTYTEAKRQLPAGDWVVLP